jgi:hypothetical protein
MLAQTFIDIGGSIGVRLIKIFCQKPMDKHIGQSANWHVA